jgi:hypothetical protein
MMHASHFFFVLTACLSMASAFATSIDQSQVVSTGYNDWGDGTGQTFIPSVRGLLTGVDFAIKYSSNPGTIEVYLWKADAKGKPIEPKIATGYLDKTAINLATSAWYTISFDQPYAQSPGERLAFTIHLVTSGSSGGWNDYGYVNSNLYTNGCKISYSPSWSPGYFNSTPNTDWAFRTRVIPSSDINLSRVGVSGLELSTPSSDCDAYYVLQTCTNLSSGLWQDLTSRLGTGAPLIWALSPGTDEQKFFRLRIIQRE